MESQEIAQPAAPSALGLATVYYAFFRHKWKILLCTLLGLAAAGAAYFVIKVPYVSSARVLIRYVEERESPTAIEDGSRIVRIESRGGETVVRTEVDILTSSDLALEVARQIGPERLLAEPTSDANYNLQAAAGVVRSGLLVETARNSKTLNLTFTNQNPGIVQPVLAAVIEEYKKRHLAIHRSSGSLDAALVQETDQLRSRLQQTEEELRKLLSEAGVVDMANARQVLAARLARIQEDILANEADLAESRAQIAAVLGNEAPAQAADSPAETPDATGPSEIPAEKLIAHRQALLQLPVLYQREQELLVQFTAETPMVKGVRAQIAEQEALRQRLESEFPQLRSQSAPLPTPRQTIAPAASTFDVAAARARIAAIEARRTVLNNQLERVRADLGKLGTMESSIAELQRTREMQEQQYRAGFTNLARARADQTFGPGSISNINVVQSPSMPGRDTKQRLMIVAGLAVSGLIVGLGIAALIELLLDHSVRRPAEVERALQLPLILSIPHRGRIAAPALPSTPHKQLAAGATKTTAEPEAGASAKDKALVPWAADQELRKFFDALRNRIVYSFEMRGITRKPKLVAVTSCSSASGVTTVASGLAASLSETGDGNVLLVDLNPERKSARHFHRGNLNLALDDALQQEKRDDALVSENLYVVSPDAEENRLSWLMPKRFATLVPKLKASDYDYIIFDLPPVSQISATPQIARFMDQVLMVVESEKTNRESARKAGAILTEAGANVAVVLNKTKSYVPTALDPEAITT